MKNKLLLVIAAGVFAVCAAALGYAAWKIMKRPAAGTGVVGRIHREAAVVATFDLRNLRAWQPAAELHQRLARDEANASEWQREASRRYQDFVRNCVDPWERLDAVTVGFERAAVAGTDQGAAVLFADGSASHADLERCIRWVAAQDRRTVTAGSAGRRPTFTLSREGEAPAARSTQFTLLPAATMVTEAQYAQRALAVIDGDQPSLRADDALPRMTTRLGSRGFLTVAVDLAELRARQARTVDQGIDELARMHPGAPDLTLLRQARVGGLALAVAGQSLEATVRVELPSPSNAQGLTRACDAVLAQRRPEALEAIRNARASQQVLRATLGAVQGMGARFERIDQGFTAVEQAVQQLACRADGADAVLGASLTQAQITALRGALEAFAEIMQEASRLNPLGNILRPGRPGGLELGVPGLDDARRPAPLPGL